MPRLWPAVEITGAALQPLAEILSALLDDFDPLGIEEEDDRRWRVFFRHDADRDRAQAALAALFARDELAATPIEVIDPDWAERAQATLRAVRVGRIVVAPPWDVPIQAPDDAADGLPSIVIVPSQAFGTGHHASTRLCLAALQGVPLDGRRVLDVGTGSAVLALAAARLGASSVTGIDHDPDALASARRNLQLNPDGTRVILREEDLANLHEVDADVLVANLTAPQLVRQAPVLSGSVAPAGYLILAGFSPADTPEIEAAFAPWADLVGETQEDDWACLMLRRYPPRSEV